MATSASSPLSRVKTFEELLEYLQEHLDWPIDDMEVDDLTFDYDPEGDLGLDPKTAAKIKNNTIKQLRPLRDDQPFGIFFLEFEPKRLPVTALRRILGRLVTKKRASANPADRKTWTKDDLIFASVYGDKEHRRIDFAHFADDNENGLPTLRVLGWDEDDTERKLDWVESRLKEKLTWPHKESTKEWRVRWRDAFILRNREVVDTSKQLAKALAALAQRIRTRVLEAMAIESKAKGPLHKLHKAFQDSLIHDLSPQGFADMYAQTIAYGLLSAAMSRVVPGEPNALVADDAALIVPNTNPFLRELMEEFLRIGGRRHKAPGSGVGIDFDELGVNDVVALLKAANMEAVIADFGRTKPGEDPVIHFYEDFMTAYDKKQKVSRGVFYTPKPVVSFIVRSVDEILRDEFGLPLGLADTTTWGEMTERSEGLTIPEGVSPDTPFVQILDPATGTGTFLVETIDLIHTRMVEKWKGERKSKAEIDRLWNEYVPDHLLPRLYGFELMMAPYAIAHMKIGLKLRDTGYRFQSEQRLRVFLTNSLEPPMDLSEMLEFVAPFLAHEARAANAIKRSLRPTVAIGNPPYSQYSANLTDTAKSHIHKYRFANGHRIRARNALQLERNLNDDYVKFVGLCTTQISRSNAGVLGMITNRTFLDSGSLVGFRQRHCEEFSGTAVLDLHGDLEASRRIPSLSGDQNVFQITQGVAITLLWRVPAAMARRSAGALVGTSESKLARLGTESHARLAVKTTEPTAPDWWLDSREVTKQLGMPLIAAMPIYATLPASNRDHLVIDFEDEPLLERMRAVAAFRGTDAKLCEKFDITLKPGWRIGEARRQLRAIAHLEAWIANIQYRPFDYRRIFFHPLWIWQYSPAVSRNLIGRTGNLVLVSLGRNRAGTTNGFWVTSAIADKGVVSSRDNASGFPLYCYPEEGSLNAGAGGTANFAPPFVSAVEQATGLSFVSRGSGDLRRTFGPSTLLHYIYALFYSNGYRKHCAISLVSGFPQVLIPRTPEAFILCAKQGADLVAVHLLESPRLDHPIAIYQGAGKRAVEVPAFNSDTVWIDEAQTRGFFGVPEAVWNFHIGGYQVCEKWLKDRKGRALSKDDIEHYQKIVVALSETIRIMGEIDEVIDAHGGWPGAFVTEPIGKPESEGPTLPFA